MAKVTGVYDRAYAEAVGDAAGQKGLLAKQVKKFKQEFIPLGKAKINVSEIRLPDEYAAALQKLYPGLKLNRAIRKHVILTIKLSTLETKVVKAK